MRAWVNGLVSLAVLSACAAHVSDDVRKRYTERVRQLALIPVYPPREDLQVGDLYIGSDFPGKEEHAVSNYVATEPAMVALAQAYLDGRIAFKQTDSKEVDGQTDKSHIAMSLGDDLADGSLKTRKKDGTILSLPLAVFPEVTANAGLSLNAGLLAPLQALGLFGGSSTSVTLGFNDVRTYGVSPLMGRSVAGIAVCRRFPGGSADGPAKGDRDFVKAQGEAEDAGPLPRLGERRMQYRVITKLYLTRQITYTYQNAQILALAKKTLGADGAATKNPATPTMTVINVNGTPTDANSAANALAAVQKTIADAGNGFEFGSLSALGLSIRRVFKQPVAVAYEGVTFDITSEKDFADLANRCKNGLAEGVGANDGTGVATTSSTPTR